MRILHSLFTFAGLAILAFPQSAKADIWLYQVTNSEAGFNFHVEFQLSNFVQDVVQQTALTDVTTDFGSITAFSISGGSGGCSAIDVGAGSSASIGIGPCWALVGPSVAGVTDSNNTPAFDGPGTFSKAGTTVIITNLSSVPEPASWTLLSMAAAGAGLLARRRRHASPDQSRRRLQI